MDNNIDNKTLSSILDQLRDLNNNLSNGNLTGGDNRLFRPNRGRIGNLNDQRANLRQEIEDSKNLRKELNKKIEEQKEKIGKASSSRSAASMKGWLKKYNEALDEQKKIEEEKLNDLKRLRTETAKAYAPAIKQAFTSISNIIFTVLETNIRKQGIKLQAASELQTRAIQTYGKALNNAIAVQVSNVTGNVLDTAYQSLNAVIEGGRSIYMKSLADSITYRRRENELYKANVERNAAIVDSVGDTMAAFGGTVGLIGNALSVIASVGKRAAMVKAAQTELEIKREEMIRQTQDETLQQIEGVVKQFADMSKQVTKSFLDAGNSAYAYGRTVGFTGNALRLYHDRLIEGVNLELSKLAMDFNDYVKMQSSYEGATGGRTGILATREAMMIGGLSKRLGLSAEEASTMVGSMNVFNTSIADGSQMIYEMSRMANRMGLSANKFAKELEKNLKLAERYQFKGGVNGMMQMALWAQRTRFNMDELTSLQEKMLSGNLEEVIQTSARLNVLGGNAALFSDPMQMLYAGINDPAALAKNVNRMIRGYGRFNAGTGETEFNSVEMLRMNAIAQATGMSRENLMNQARQAQKSAQIGRQYGGKFGKMTDFVTQQATWSKEKGDWIIKVNAPGTAQGFTEKTLSELSGANDKALQNIFPEDKQDRLINYIQDIRNYLSPGEQQGVAEKNSLAATMAEASKRGLFESQEALAAERMRYTGLNVGENGEMVMKFSEAALVAQKQMNDFVSKGAAKSIVESYLAFSNVQNEKLLAETEEQLKTQKSIENILESVRNRYVTATNEKKNQPKATTSLVNNNYSSTSTFRTQVRDAVITPRGTVYTHPDDMIAAFKPNGEISKSFSNQSSKLEVSGTLRLETDGQSIDLVALLKSNPDSMRRLAEEVIIEGSRTRYGGRSLNAPGRYTLG